MTLAEWLRKEIGLTGTKIVCAEGDCGSCTVLRAFHNATPQFESMNSCIALVAQMDGSHIVTVEGMQCGDALSPAQKAMHSCHASQCGYCTPGFVMAMSAMLERHERAPPKTVANYLTGNLCRCTGYSTIIEAGAQARATEEHSVARRYSNPAAIADIALIMKQSLRINHDGIIFCAPTSLREATTFSANHPSCRVIAAATDVGVQLNKGKPLPRAMLSLHLIPALHEIKRTRTGLSVGARVTLAQVRRECANISPEFARFLDLFASPQIKNVATLVGNVANASPIGDTLPFLMIAGGRVHLASRPDGKGALRTRSVAIADLFVGYKQLAIEAGEIITHLSFDGTKHDEFLRLCKVSKRKDLDISAVSGAFSMTIRRARKPHAPAIVESARIAFGGVAATPIRLPRVEASLVGELTADRLDVAAKLIAESITPISDVRGSAAYRRVLAVNLFRRYGREVIRG